MKDLFKKLKCPSKLLAVVAAVWLLVSSNGGCEKIGITNETLTKALNSVSSVIAVVGVFAEPDKNKTLISSLLSKSDNEKNEEKNEEEKEEEKDKDKDK